MRASFDRPRLGGLVLAVVLALGVSACPARQGNGGPDPGPPVVLDPTLLDRG